MSDFKNELEQEVEFINDLISRYLPDETGLDKKIREAMNYSVNAGGKRVRPMLMLEVYKLCGGDDCQVVYPFMAAEWHWQVHGERCTVHPESERLHEHILHRIW